MILINTTTKKYPVQYYELAQEFNNISFPEDSKYISDFELEELGYARVELVNRPTYDPSLQTCKEVEPKEINGVWTQQWELTDIPQATLEERAAAEFQNKVRQFDWILTSHLDKKAQEKRYDNRISCAVRAGFDGPFQVEAILFAQWMDACNVFAYQLLEEIKAGTKPIPTTEEFIASLPPFDWNTL